MPNTTVPSDSTDTTTATSNLKSSYGIHYANASGFAHNKPFSTSAIHSINQEPDKPDQDDIETPFDSLHSNFRKLAEVRNQFFPKDKTIVNLSLSDLINEESFKKKIKYKSLWSGVLIKVCFSGKVYRMAGDQLFVRFVNDNDLLSFRRAIIDRIRSTLEEYSYKPESIFTEKSQYKIVSELNLDNKVISMINNISATPFKVNTDLLDFISSEFGSSLLIQESEIILTESTEKWSQYKLAKHTSIVSKYVHQELILRIANLFKNYNSIYFPVKLDQRGRLYCIPPYFNYQSSNLAKALILFTHPGIIHKSNLEDSKYLLAYGANCFGGTASKGSIASKVKWVEENSYDIINFHNGTLLKKAKESLLFLAFCIEYKRYDKFINDDTLIEFKTYLPIQLDATCNGFQHLSLLSQESKLYVELNLTNKASRPKDFYTFLLHKLLSVIKSKLEQGMISEGKASYERLNSFIWERSHVKKIIMTIPYNSSISSMKKYLIEELTFVGYDTDIKCNWYSQNNNNKTLINTDDVALLINIIKNIIKTDFTKIDNLVKYLRNVAKLCNACNLPIFWSLPSGLKIYQSYLETKSISISPFTYTKAKLNIKVTNKDKFDQNKQIRALMPNLIHSLDAHSMTDLYYRFNKKFGRSEFFSVHDCFGTTIDKVESLKNLLVYVYLDLYSDNSYLEKFDIGIINYIKNCTNYKWNPDTRTFTLEDNTTYELFDINWVLTKKLLNNKEIKRIDSQHIWHRDLW